MIRLQVLFQTVQFALVFSLGLSTACFAESPQTGWPQMNGPHGNFSPNLSSAPLVDDFDNAQLVWMSEDQDLGYAKGSASGYLQNLAKWKGHPGSCSGPILSDGKLFITTFRPSGTIWAENQPHLKGLDKLKKPLSQTEIAQMKQNMRILGDDICIAIDINSGKTVWKQIEQERGLNRYMGKRQGFCVSPACFDGVVFSMGTTGLLYAYHGKTGKKIWEANIGTSHEEALEHKANMLERKTLPGGMGWDVSLTVAAGVLIVPTFQGGADIGLRGVNVSNGKPLWELERICSRHATPARWTFQNQEYLLTATVTGKLHLIHPETGKILWSVSGLGENHFSLSPSNRFVFVNAGSNVPRKEGSHQNFGRLAAYLLSPEKAALQWEHPVEKKYLYSTWMDSCARRFLAVQNGKLFYRPHAPDKSDCHLYVLDEENGKIIAETALLSPAPQFYPVEVSDHQTKLLHIRDASHSSTEIAFSLFDGTRIQLLSDFRSPPHEQTSAYEVSMEHPIHAGFLYLRTKDGRIACYDLRSRKETP